MDICILGVLLFYGILVIMPIYVYFDTKNRGEQRPGLWAISSLFIPLIWIYWLVIRRDKPKGVRIKEIIYELKSE